MVSKIGINIGHNAFLCSFLRSRARVEIPVFTLSQGGEFGFDPRWRYQALKVKQIIDFSRSTRGFRTTTQLTAPKVCVKGRPIGPVLPSYNHCIINSLAF
jgi:hypothetical protein